MSRPLSRPELEAKTAGTYQPRHPALRWLERRLHSKNRMIAETLARRIDPDVVVQFNLQGEKVYRFSDGSEVKGG